MGTFTVKAVMPTGKNSPTYGVEYYVQFNETEQSFPMWFKTAPAVGQTLEGDIEGNKFKKVKKEWTGNSSSQASPQTVGKPTSRPFSKDNSDGMRQGMCMNNAANYVNAFGVDMKSSEWAKTVHEYASALYALGDLKVEQPIDPEPIVENVQAVFGVTN